MTILLVGALVVALAIGAFAPAASAHSGNDTQEPTPYGDAENATDARAQYIAEWMEARMGPEGVEAFEAQTGTTVEAVAAAMAEHMGPQAGTGDAWTDRPRYGPWSGDNYRAPGGGYGPQMPCGNGYGHGPGMWGGYGPGMGPGNGGAYGPGGQGYGMGGHGPGMGGGW